MKAFVIVSEHDVMVQFLWHDADFLTRLRCLYHNVDGVQPSDDPTENGHLFEELLAPIGLSYFLLLNNFKESCSVIKCTKARCNIVFQLHNNLLYLGFCETDELSVYNMQKQLHVLHEMTEFFFGPCIQNIKPVNLIDKSRTWNKLIQALHSFIELHENEQSFLVGGIERLQLNSELQMQYSNLIESSMKTLTQRLRTERITFGILFVKNKVVSYEIGAKFKHEISTADMLKIMALINSKHKEVELDAIPVDASSAADAFELSWSDEDSSTTGQNNSASVSRDGDSVKDVNTRMQLQRQISSSIRVPTLESTLADGDDDDTFLPGTSQDGTLAPRHAKVTHSQSWHGRSTVSHGSVPSPTWKKLPIHHESEAPGSETAMPNGDDMQEDEPSIDEEATLEEASILQSPLLRRKSFPTVTEISGELHQQTPRRNIQTFPVFLRTVSCHHTPFLMHLVHIAEDTTFVLLAEMKGAEIAKWISTFLSELKQIRFCSRTSDDGTHIPLVLEIDGGQKTYDKIGNCCKQLKSRLSHSSDQQLRRIIDLWEKKISRQLLAHFKKQKLSEIPRLEQNVSELTRNLQNLFHRLFLVKPNKSKRNWRKQLDIVALEMERKLNDHLEFFHVKAYRNISINWTHSQYPGMLHFVLTKRVKTSTRFGGLTGSGMPLLDEVFSSGFSVPPAAEQDGEVVDKNLVLCLKNQAWKGIMMAYSYLDGKEGISEFSATEGDFRFTTYIWARPIESQSSQLSGFRTKLTDCQWKGEASISGFQSPFWSVESIGGNGAFIFCELHLVHFSTVPRTMIMEQSSRLDAELKQNKIDT